MDYFSSLKKYLCHHRSGSEPHFHPCLTQLLLCQACFLNYDSTFIQQRLYISKDIASIIRAIAPNEDNSADHTCSPQQAAVCENNIGFSLGSLPNVISQHKSSPTLSIAPSRLDSSLFSRTTGRVLGKDCASLPVVGNKPENERVISNWMLGTTETNLPARCSTQVDPRRLQEEEYERRERVSSETQSQFVKQVTFAAPEVTAIHHSTQTRVSGLTDTLHHNTSPTTC